MPHAEDLGVEDVAEVLSEIYRIDFNIKNDEAHFKCIVHNDSNPSADCNLKTGLWQCFSCGASGDLIDLGVAVDGGILYQRDLPKDKRRKRAQQRERVHKMLVPDSPDALQASTRRRVKANLRGVTQINRKEDRKSVPIPPLGSYEDGPLDSLYERGFKDEFLRDWNVRYATSARLVREDGKEFDIEHSVAIPIVEEEDVIGWMYRSTDRSEKWRPKYLYTPGINLSETWFGLDHVSSDEEVTVTEGALDAMWLSQHGYPSLAILGSNVKNPKKLRQLANFRKVCLFPDRDNAGLAWVSRVGWALQDMGVGVTVVSLAAWMLNKEGAPAKDANELCSLDLELVRELAVPYQAWKMMNHGE